MRKVLQRSIPVFLIPTAVCWLGTSASRARKRGWAERFEKRLDGML